MTNPTKLRPFYIAKYLYELTDEENTLTTTDIIKKLEEDYGISTYRQTVASDIEILRSIGIDIQEYNSTQKHYSLASRTFDLPELKILIDAVLSAKFITEKKSKELVGKLSLFTGKNKAEELRRNISVENRVKKDNEQIYLIIDAIDKAITNGYKISFRYFKYNVLKEKSFTNSGAPHIVSPNKLVWNGEYYYMIGMEEGSIKTFRLDRIEKRPEDLPFEKAESLPDDYDWEKSALFRMYGTDFTEVQLICDNEMMDAIIDRFGIDVTTYAYDMEHFRADVEVAVSNVFFSWIFGFEGKVRILGPESVKEKYDRMVEKENTFLANYRHRPIEEQRWYFVTVYRNKRGIKEDCYGILHQENCKLFLVGEEEFRTILDSGLFNDVNEKCNLLIDYGESESLRPEDVLVCDELYHSLNLPENGQMAKALAAAKEYGFGLSFDF